MMARVLVALSLLAIAGIALAPTAEARPPADLGDCAVGDNEAECLVSVHWVVCVTDPCDPMRICLLYGFICV